MERYDERGERATRDIVSRAIDAEMRAGRTTPNGGVYLSMGHLGPDNVRRQFKGMVERCADCGFDLAAGKVEVVPTAHYMMGGVEFAPDCTTERPGLFVAGEDSGGVHGANRLGGNGVANSTVFGGIAGDTIAAWLARDGAWREPDAAALDAAVARAEAPFARKRAAAGALESIRERLYDVMWDDAGIVRDARGLARAAVALESLGAELAAHGPPGRRARVQPDVARRAQSREPDRGVAGDRPRGGGARGLARRALPIGPSGHRRPRDVGLRARPATRSSGSMPKPCPCASRASHPAERCFGIEAGQGCCARAVRAA